ncbi:hypothetical protein RHGRI_009158 [Rhododendron griersonianum]|uniref:Serine-rich protein n=1 Tax=Rhododendron griersonianum TaxID=479676 RepID=A0AAV6L557_9ERIC|nr:hypothetical protein RHGRI_009158 [Rhododendron griersonianum]
MAAPTRRSSGPVLRSLPPSAKLPSPPTPSSSVLASSISAFSSQSIPALRRPTSPPPALRFSFDRPISPIRSLSVSARLNNVVNNQVVKKKPLENQKRTCMCSPTTHPGSFRCSFHKNLNDQKLKFPSNRLNTWRTAMTNSLVRIGTVEGDLVRRALAALIRPSSHQQRRRAGFNPTPSRLSIMSNANDV